MPLKTSVAYTNLINKCHNPDPTAYGTVRLRSRCNRSAEVEGRLGGVNLSQTFSKTKTQLVLGFSL
jgi:hypothetical protein